MGKIGVTELLLIILALLLLFGGRKIPELMKGLGQGIREFKKASKGETDDPAVEDFKKSINNEANKK
jgi:sec-independent protein translocase protein TatA